MRDVLHVDPKQMELQTDLYDERKKAPRQYCFSLDFKKLGGQKPWSVIALFVRDFMAEHSFFWSRNKILPCICKSPRSSASVWHKSLFYNVHWIRRERGREGGLVIY